METELYYIYSLTTKRDKTEIQMTISDQLFNEQYEISQREEIETIAFEAECAEYNA